MNLLVKKKIGWLIAIGVLFFGCKDEIGLELSPDVQQTNVEFIEFNLPTTNLYFDSLRTDDATSLLVGDYSDEIFGTIKSTGYSEFSYRSGPLPFFFFNSNGTLINNDAFINFDSLAFESITISLRMSEILTNQATLVQSLEFFEITEPLFSNVIYLGDRELSLGESLGSDDDSFNSIGVSLLNLRSDTLLAKFELDEAFGLALFDRIRNLDPSDTDSLTAGLIRFPGIAFVSNGSNGIVLYELEDELTNLELRMKSKSPKSDSTYLIQFRFSDAIGDSRNFNHIERDRSGSDFALLENGKSLDIDSDFVYFNPIAGILPRIDLAPYLDFATQGDLGDIVIQRAELSISGTPSDDFISNANRVKFYFSNADSTNSPDVDFSINWSGIALDPIGTLLQTDNTYLGNFPSDIEALADSVTNNYRTFPNVFFQDILDQKQTGAELYSDNLVMVSPSGDELGRAKIYKDSVKLKVFFVKFN